MRVIWLLGSSTFLCSFYVMGSTDIAGVMCEIYLKSQMNSILNRKSLSWFYVSCVVMVKSPLLSKVKDKFTSANL